MSPRSWCVACLALGAIDLAVINLAVGPRLLPETPLVAAVEVVAARRPLSAALPKETEPIHDVPAIAVAAHDRAVEPPSAAATAEVVARPAGGPGEIEMPVAEVAAPAAAVEPAVAAVEPKAIELAAVEPKPVEPKPVEPAAVEPKPAEPAVEPAEATRPLAVAVDGDVPSGSTIIHFATDRATLWPAAQAKLDELAKTLRDRPGLSLQIAGHADARGTDDHNRLLSERRVRRVREYLEARGVAGHRVAGRAFGEQAPLVEGDDDDALLRNRRVEITFTRSAP